MQGGFLKSEGSWRGEGCAALLKSQEGKLQQRKLMQTKLLLRCKMLKEPGGPWGTERLSPWAWAVMVTALRTQSWWGAISCVAHRKRAVHPLYPHPTSPRKTDWLLMPPNHKAAIRVSNEAIKTSQRSVCLQLHSLLLDEKKKSTQQFSSVEERYNLKNLSWH